MMKPLAYFPWFRSAGRLLYLLILLSWSVGCAETETYEVAPRDLVEAVYAPGTVLPVDFHEVTSKVPGIIDSIFVETGQRVKPGDVLLRLKSQPNEMNLATARNLYKLARQHASAQSDQLQNLAEKVETALASYRLDSIDFERYHRLQQQGIGSRQEYERAQLRFQTSKSNYLMARRNLQDTRDRLQIELQNAANNVRALESQLGDYQLLASKPGKIYDIVPRQGELVHGTQPLMELGAADTFEIELWVDETDIMLIHPGQAVVYQLEALHDSILRGQVSRILPRIDPIDKTATVMASIDHRHYDLYPGMTLEANIIIREKSDVLAIPTEYLSQNQTVLLRRQGKAEQVPVKTGIRDLEFAEILDGLQPGDEIIKP